MQEMTGEQLFNVSGADAFAIVPEGTFGATVTKAEATLTRAGDPMVTVTYTVEGDKGRVRGFYSYREGDAQRRFFFKRDLSAVLGGEAAFTAAVAGVPSYGITERLAQALLGRKVTIVVKHTDPDDEGRVYANIKTTKAAGVADPLAQVTTAPVVAQPAPVAAPAPAVNPNQMGVNAPF